LLKLPVSRPEAPDILSLWKYHNNPVLPLNQGVATQITYIIKKVCFLNARDTGKVRIF